MKHLMLCLLMGCLASPAWGAEHLEEFVQKLEAAKPWTHEKIEEILGIKFETPPGARTDHKAYGQFVCAEGLIVIKKINLRVSGATGETNILTLFLDDKSSCVKIEWAKKKYPDGYVDTSGSHYGRISYVQDEPWGELGFVFEDFVEDPKRAGCLADIDIITNAFIKKYRDKPRRPFWADPKHLEKLLKE